MDAEAQKWARVFAQAITAWCKTNHIRKGELASLLDIPKDAATHGMRGYTVMSREYYARMYCFTGLPEADPRTIPPRLSKNGHRTPRRMTEEEWAKWHNNYGALYEPYPSEGLSARLNEVLTDIMQVTNRLEANDPMPFEDLAFGQALTLITSTMERAMNDEQLRQSMLGRYQRGLIYLYWQVKTISIEDPTDREAIQSAMRRYKL